MPPSSSSLRSSSSDVVQRNKQQRDMMMKNGKDEVGVHEKKKKKRQKVCWGNLTIYEFTNILGDNPAVSEGIPLTIGWKPITKEVVSIEYYELLARVQRGSRRRRKSRRNLLMSKASRDTYLLGLGYSLGELGEVAEEIRMIRNSRLANMNGSLWEKFQRALETARGIKRGPLGGPKTAAPLGGPKTVAAAKLG